MIREKVKIINPTGLHMKPAGMLCQEAIKFKAEISFEYDNIKANAKSVLSVLAACVKKDQEVTFIFDGIDEEEASKAIIPMIRDGFGEDCIE